MRTMQFDNDDIAGGIGGVVAVVVYGIAQVDITSFVLSDQPMPPPASTSIYVLCLVAIVKFAVIAIMGGVFGKLGKDLYDGGKETVKAFLNRNKSK